MRLSAGDLVVPICRFLYNCLNVTGNIPPSDLSIVNA